MCLTRIGVILRLSDLDCEEPKSGAYEKHLSRCQARFVSVMNGGWQFDEYAAQRLSREMWNEARAIVVDMQRRQR